MKPLITTLAILAILVPGATYAADDRCPIESLSHAAIEKGIKDAPGCGASLKIFQKCSTGASGDVAFGEIVTGKCEAAFEGKLSARQKSAYSRALRVCDTKHAREAGSMYRSFEAFCRAQAAYQAARPFLQPEPKAASK